MFTTGRIIFAIFFVIAFVIFIVWSYKKDAKSHQFYYKNAAKKVALYSLAVIVLFVLIRFITRV